MRLGFPAGATIPLTAPGMWYSTSDNNFHVFDGVTDRTSEVILAVNSLVIHAFISLVTLVLLGFSASPASS
jgi:hypothetical protein